MLAFGEAFFGLMLWFGFNGGRMPVLHGSPIDREENPALFWFFASLYAGFCLLFVGVFFWIWIDPSIIPAAVGLSNT